MDWPFIKGKALISISARLLYFFLIELALSVFYRMFFVLPIPQ